MLHEVQRYVGILKQRQLQGAGVFENEPCWTPMFEFSLPQFTYLERGKRYLPADLAGALWG